VTGRYDRSMELTPQALRDVEFREKLRGYHQDDVDDFLEEVAVALDALLTRLQVAEAGAAAPSLEASPAADPVVAEQVSEDTLRRTLLLAQRTADLAVAEAEESARSIIAGAQSEASRIMAEAEGNAAATAKAAQTKAEGLLADLEHRRGGLEREVASLQGWASQQRDRLRDVLSDQIRALDIWLATSGTPRPVTARPAAPAASGPAPHGGDAPVQAGATARGADAPALLGAATPPAAETGAAVAASSAAPEGAAVDAGPEDAAPAGATPMPLPPVSVPEEEQVVTLPEGETPPVAEEGASGRIFRRR
jgi:DivIVA domain-containing protein